MPSAGPELDTVFDNIIRELRTQYLVGFYPKNIPLGASPFHSIKVTLTQPGLRAITRNGYYGDSEDSTGRSRRR